MTPPQFDSPNMSALHETTETPQLQSRSRRPLGTTRRLTAALTVSTAGLGLVAILSFAHALPTLPLVLLAMVCGAAAFAGGLALHDNGAAGEDKLLAHIARRSPESRLVTEPDGMPVFANDAFRNLFGITGDDLSSLEQQCTGDAEALEKVRRLLHAARSGAGARDEIHVRDANGAVRWLSVQTYAIGEAAEKIVWFIADITAQRELQSVLQEEQARLVDILENAPVGFYSVDENGKFVMVNRLLAEWLGWATSELTGGMAVADVAFELDGAPLVLPTMSADTLEPRRREAVLKAHDGEERLVQITEALAQDGASGQWRTRSVVLDLTREREREAALRRAEQRFRGFFDFAPVAVLTVNADNQVAEANPTFRALAGEGRDVLGTPLVELFDADDRDDLSQRIADTWAGEPQSVIEVRLADWLESRTAQVYASRLEDGAGAITGLLLHLIDTTDQRNLELQFAQSQKMQAVGQLAGGVAHDFNNLLTAIIGHCDLLLQRTSPGQEAFPDLMQVKQNANRAANLVRQLLAFSRRQTLRPEILFLTDELTELSHLLRRLIGENIELNISHGRDLGLVKVDRNQLEQVIINLAVNARDAIASDGVVEIRTRNIDPVEVAGLDNELMPAADYVLIEVADTGKGIPKQDLGKIFEPFFTTKAAGTGTGSGTGLGLSTVYGIIKQTGGFIFPESEVGRGTVFRVYLPRHEPTEAEAKQVAKGVAEGDDELQPKDLTGKGTILLVEDEDAVRMFASRALRNKGYTVFEAPGGYEALELLDEHEDDIDLLISDVVMPHMDGPTLMKEVRIRKPEMKVIFISGYAEDAFRENLDPDAEFDLLPKPFSLKQLAGKVKDLFDADRG